MSILNWLFKKKSNLLANSREDRIGRYTDAYKSDAQLASWEEARVAFENNEFFKSCLSLLKYIFDEKEENVKWEENEGKVSFEIIQGSKKVNGSFNNEGLNAEVSIAKANDLNIGLLRRLIDQSTVLLYSNYAIAPDNTIVIRFATDALDGSPYKIFHGLKEIALQSDKQDDLLLHDFDVLEIIDASLRNPIDEKKKNAKYEYSIELIKHTFEHIEAEKDSLEKNPKTVTYLYLDVLYKISYLSNPEGFTMDIMEDAQYLFFQNDNKGLQQKNNQLRKSLQKILDLPKENLIQEFYTTKSSFGIAPSVSHDTFVKYFDTEFAHIDSYYRQNQPLYAHIVANNIVGFCLNNFTLPKPDRELLELYYKLFENSFFNYLGVKTNLTDQNNALNPKLLAKAFDEIINKNKSKYPRFRPSIEQLDFFNTALLARSYLLMVRNLDLTRSS